MTKEFYSNLIQISNDLIVTGKISSQDIFYGDGSGLFNLPNSEVSNLSSKLDSVYSTVQTSSALEWKNKPEWDSVYTTVQEKSATEWDNTLSNQYTHLNFLPLSGGTINGNLNTNNNITSGGVNLDLIFSKKDHTHLASDITDFENAMHTYDAGGLWDSIVNWPAVTVENGNLDILSSAGRIARLTTNQILSSRNYILPDKSGVLALTGDIFYDKWDSVYSTVQTSSATEWKNKPEWDSVYSNVLNLSSSWEQGSAGYNWTYRSGSDDNNWRSIAYGNGLFVAISNSGTSSNRLMTSPDGINWTLRAFNESILNNYNWTSITYGNGIFVAVSTGGLTPICISSDGINWTPATVPIDNVWTSVTYGNGIFVAVSNDGVNRAISSPNGIDWSIRSATESSTWKSVTYGNGLFVAVADFGPSRAMTSPDGITWTFRYSLGANTWKSVTYGNGLFVAVADSGTNRIATSPNGVTWTAINSLEANTWKSVTYGNGLFVAVADSGTNRIATSPNGVTWTAINIPGNNFWTSITYGNGIFVAVAASGDNKIVTSGKQINNSEEKNKDNITQGNKIHYGNLTVSKDISASGNILGENIKSNNWNNVYSTVQTSSATDWKNKPEWDSAYTTVQTSSATNWDNKKANEYTHLNFLPLSGGTITNNLTVSSTLFVGDGAIDFIVTEEGRVGLGTETPNQQLTVNGNISSNSVIYTSNGNSNDWNSVFTNVNTNSSYYIPSKTSLVNSSPSASAINNMVVLSQAAYTSILTKDPSTVYIII